MKKFLLPLAGLLLCGSAMAEEVTVSYYTYEPGAWTAPDFTGATPVFQSTTHEVTANDDGSYTISDFMNAKNSAGASKAITFSFDEDGYVTFVGFNTSGSLATGIQNSTIAGTDFYANLNYPDGSACTPFPAAIWYPTKGYYKNPVSLVTKLGDDSEYTYKVILAGVAKAPIPAELTTGLYGNAGGVACVFEMGKKENGGGEDDYEVKAGEVRVKYLNTGLSFYANEITGEAFQPTINESVVNEDGSITIKNYLNAGFDFTFTIDSKTVASAGFPTTGYQAISVKFPELTSGGMVLMKNKELTEADPDSDDNYKYDLTTVEGFQLGNDVFAVQPSSGNIYVQSNVSGAELLEETPLSKTYRVYFRHGWKLHINKFYGEKIDGEDVSPVWVTSWLYGWTSFDVVVPAVPNVTYKRGATSTTAAFEPTASIIKVDKAEGSVTVDYFAGGEGSISFTLNYDKLVNGNPGLTFAGLNNDAALGTPVEGAKYSLQPVPTGTNPNPAIKEGDLYIVPSKSYAKAVSADYQTTQYEVWVGFQVGGTSTYFAIFNVELPSVPKGDDMTVNYTAFNNATNIFETVDTKIEQIDENTILFYDFGNSGYNIPFAIGEKTSVEGQAYTAQSSIGLVEDYIRATDSFSGSTTVKLPGDATFVVTVKDKGTYTNAVIYPESSWVRYYNDRVDYHVVFGSGSVFFAANWSVSTRGSGLSEVVVDENAPVEWYNLQGRRVNGENLAPGIYIKRQGNKAVKVLVK